MSALLGKKIKRVVSALLRGARFFVLLAVLYILVGVAGVHLQSVRAVAGGVTGLGTPHYLARWILTPEASITAESTLVDFGGSTNIHWCGNDSHGCANVTTCKVGTTLGGSDISTICSGTYRTGPINSEDGKTFYLSTTGSTGDGTASVFVGTRNRPPVAVAGISRDASSPRTYVGTDTGHPFKVPKGVPLTLYFAPYTGQFPHTTSISADLDTDPAKGILNGGKCEWNSDLSIDAANPGRFDTQIDITATIGNDFPFDSIDATKDCIASANHTFNDAGGIYHLYRLTDKAGGKSNVADVTITAVAAPAITFFGPTATINQDQKFILGWTSTDTISCSSPDNDFNDAIAGRTSGSVRISDLHTSPKSYILNCVSTDPDLWPTPATQTATVTINQCMGTLAPSRTNVARPGDPITLTWSAGNARNCSINGVLPSPICSADAVCKIGGTTGNIAVTSPITFTLSCTGDAGPCAVTTPTISVDNQPPTAVAGASLDPTFGRTYSNTITVTQNAATDIYLSAGPKIDGVVGGTADSDGSLTKCGWNTDFDRSPPTTIPRHHSGGSP